MHATISDATRRDHRCSKLDRGRVCGLRSFQLLGDGTRLPKFHPRIVVLGSIDEAKPFIGLACQSVRDDARLVLERVQSDLFDVGADLCTPERKGLKVEPPRFDEAKVAQLETDIATSNTGLASLTSFALPNGSLAATYLHVARSIVRRAEREIVEVAFQAPVTPAIVRHLNRLYDLLFIMARIENDRVASDRLWRLGGL